MLMMLSKGSVMLAGHEGRSSESRQWKVASGWTRLTECASAAALGK